MEKAYIPQDKSYVRKLLFFRWGISTPGLIAQVIFGWAPLVMAFLISFQTFNFQKSTWCGLDNYKSILTDPVATPFSITMANRYYDRYVENYKDGNLQSPNILLKGWYRLKSMVMGIGTIWRNTLYYAIMVLTIIFFVPIIVAVLLMEMPSWLIRIMMLLWFIPIAAMASTIIIKYFYNVDYGLLNGIIAKYYDFINLPMEQREYPRWLNSPDIAMLCIALPKLIMYTPGLVYITALQGIPQDLYDAAEIDGCNFLQKIWNVTIPRLRPIITTMLIFSLIEAFQIFREIMIMTQGGPAGSTLTIAYYIYKLGFEFLEIGKSNALAVMFFLFLMALTIIQRTIIKEDIDTGPSKKTEKMMKKDQ